MRTRAGTCIALADPSHIVPYGALIAGRQLHRAIDPRAPLGSGAQHAIGKSIPRVDLPAKVAGTFRYVHDVRVPGMLHGRVILPPRTGSKLESVDESSLAGLAERVRVVRNGNVLGVVAAKESHAVRAAEMLRVRGAHTARAVYSWPFQSHGSIGPSCAVADVRPGGTTIWSPTQGVYPLRGAIAGLLGIATDSVHVTYVQGAGCYGQNGADDASAAAALLSQAVGAPVRVQYSRADETRWDPKGPAMVMELRGALDLSGKIAAWDYQVWTPSHSGRPDAKPGRLLPAMLNGAAFGNAETFAGGDRNAKTNYTLPAQRVTIYDQPTALVRYSALRGLGGTQNTFANESFVDELAHMANANPIDFRIVHLSDERAPAVLEAVREEYRPGRGVAFVRYENTGAYVAAVALIVNPDGLRNQIEGNVVQATSRALFEEVRFGPDGVTSVDWSTYPIMRFRDVPVVSIALIDRPAERIVGGGEATTTVMAPAIANAIFAQTGARLRTAPFTPERVLGALHA